MAKFKQRFMTMTKIEQIAFCVGLISSLIVILSGIIHIMGINNMAVPICEVCMGITMITQAIMQWRKNRRIAIFSLCVAIFVFFVAFIIVFD